MKKLGYKLLDFMKDPFVVSGIIVLDFIVAFFIGNTKIVNTQIIIEHPILALICAVIFLALTVYGMINEHD